MTAWSNFKELGNRYQTANISGTAHQKLVQIIQNLSDSDVEISENQSLIAYNKSTTVWNMSGIARNESSRADNFSQALLNLSQLFVNQSALVANLSVLTTNLSNADSRVSINISLGAGNWSLGVYNQSNIALNTSKIFGNLVNLSEISRNRMGGIVLSTPVYQWCPGSSATVTANTNATTAGWGPYVTVVASGDLANARYLVATYARQNASYNSMVTLQFALGNQSINTVIDEHAFFGNSDAADSLRETVETLPVPVLLDLATYGNEVVARAQAGTNVSLDVLVRIKVASGLLV